MEIQSIKYSDAAQTSLSVTLLDGTQLFVPWPCNTWHGEFIQKWILLGNAIGAAFTPTELVSKAKAAKIEELRAERLVRIQAVLPGVTSDDTLELMSEMWLSIAPAARQATATWQNAINIYTAGKQAGIAVNALTTVAEIELYNVATNPSWPVI